MPTNRDPEARYDRQLAQVVEQWWEEVRKTFHTSMPGMVHAYDAATKRAKVQPAFTLKLKAGQGEVVRPPILNVPLRQTATGGHMVHQQVDAGDVVLLVFAERGLDRFKAAWGELATPGVAFMSERDAMAVPWGVETITPVVPTGWVVQNTSGDTFISLQGPDQTVTVEAGGNRVVVTAEKIVLEVAADQHVYLGGEGGEELATKSFVEDQFNTHLHSTPSGPSGVPLQPSPLRPGTDLTKKTKSE